MFRLLEVILVFFIICVSATQVFAREQITVKATQNDKYIRVLFYCKQPMPFNASINGDKLKISFKHQVQMDASPIAIAAGGDVNNAVFNQKSNTAVISLASHSYGVRKFMGENFIGVDILKPSAKEEQEANQEQKIHKEDQTEAEKAASLLPDELLEANITPAAGINMPTETMVTPALVVPRGVKQIKLAKILPKNLDDNKEVYISQPKLRREFVKTAVEDLPVKVAAPEATVEAKPSEEKMASDAKKDVVAKSDAAPTVTSESLVATTPEVQPEPPVAKNTVTIPVEVNAPDSKVSAVALVGEKAVVKDNPAISASSIPANAQTPANDSTKKENAEKTVAAPETPVAVKNKQAEKPVEVTATKTAPVEEKKPEEAAPAITLPKVSAPDATAAAVLQPVIPSLTDEKPEENLEAATQDEPEAVTQSVADAVKDKLLSKLVFSWDTPVAASVFKRAGYLWVVFDKAKDANVRNIIAKNSEYFTGGEQMPNRFYTILRLKLKNDINTVSYKDGDNWVVGLAKDKIAPAHIFKVDMKFSDLLGSKVTLDSESRLKPLRLIDAEVGDEIIIIPLLGESTGLKDKYKYIDFALLETSQGAVIQIISDRVDVAVVDAGLEIAGPSNRISNVAQSVLKELKEKEEEAKVRAQRLQQQSAELTMLKFNTWMKGSEHSYKKNLKELKWKITEADWAKKNELRLDLARFYLAHSLNSEALGVVKIIMEYDEKTSATNDVKVIEATALYMMDRYKDAIDVYDTMNLKELSEAHRKEVQVWRTAADINIGGQIKADKFMTKNPLKNADDEEDVGSDKVGNTKLMRDTSVRLLKMIRKMDPDFVNADELQKLEATARFVTSHYQEAIKRFEETELYSSGDIFQAEDNKLWWSASASKGASNVELPILQNIDDFLKNYPVHIFNDFTLIAIEESLKKNDLAKAEELLAVFKEENRAVAKNSIEFFRGLYYAKNEEDDKAIETWDKLTKEVFDPYNRTRAQFATTVLQLDKKKIDAKTAIANLNSVRSVWRGDQLEFHILNLLGEFYMETQKPMDGFRVWREAISAFPGSDESLLIAKKMSEKFTKIFSQGEADKMLKLDAITLYYEFRELTPIGKLGDEMISKLVDRLVDVDLIDRASALLTHQVRFRLVGADRDMASTKLVQIHLMNHNPQNAIDVLDATDNPEITPEVAKNRKYLRAQALLELGKSNKALVLLGDDESHQAAFLRGDVYWSNKVWHKVADELEVPFREIRRGEKKLTMDESTQVVKLAVAYALIDRQKRLQILYEDFAGFIDDQGKKDLLTFIATNKGPIDYNNLAQTVGFKEMEAFLTNYMKPPTEQEKG